MRVQNVSEGIRFGWREHDPKREALQAEVDALQAMKPRDIGETMAKRTELDRLHAELNAIPIKLVMTSPGEIHEVPESSKVNFLRRLTDDWAMVDAAGNVIPWPPGQHVRKTVAVTPRGLEAEEMKRHLDNLAEVMPDGNRRDPRALKAREKRETA
jgi:hypothetical protein